MAQTSNPPQPPLSPHSLTLSWAHGIVSLPPQSAPWPCSSGASQHCVYRVGIGSFQLVFWKGKDWLSLFFLLPAVRNPGVLAGAPTAISNCKVNLEMELLHSEAMRWKRQEVFISWNTIQTLNLYYLHGREIQTPILFNTPLPMFIYYSQLNSA